MKKLLLSALAVFTASQMNAQITIFEDSFEDYEDFIITNVGDWTMVDVDQQNTYVFGDAVATFPNQGALMAFIVFNSTATTPPLTGANATNWAARTGQKVMACINASGPQGAPQNDDWLISPQLQMGTSGNFVSFWAKTAEATWGLEKFKVGISTTGTAPSDFTIITSGTHVDAPDAWTFYSYDLDAYAGQEIYIAINCVSDDKFGFLVDDFKVEAAALSTDDFFSTNFSVYPNPANDVVHLQSNSGLTIESVKLADINGRTVAAIQVNGVSNTSMNIANLSAGVYILNVTSNEGVGTAKIVKK